MLPVNYTKKSVQLHPQDSVQSHVVKLRALFSHPWSIAFELGILTFILLNKQLFTLGDYAVRRYLFVICLVVVLAISRFCSFDKKRLGLSPTVWAQSIKEIIPITILACLGLILTHIYWPTTFALGYQDQSTVRLVLKYVSYLLISVPIQELAFRSYFITRMEQFTHHQPILILASSFVFGISHAPFGSWFITIGSMFFSIPLAINFLRYRNLYTLVFAHAIVGILLIYFINLN